MIAEQRLRPHPDINDVKPFSSDDEACFGELRDVLARHGALERFGITLLHGHFEIADDEILVESIDVENRTLTTRPAKATEVAGDTIETNWRLDVREAMQRCERVCQRPWGPSGPHNPNHIPTG